MTQHKAQHKDGNFQSARLWFFPAAVACLRLQEMRRRSLGMSGPYTLAAIANMSATEAASGYVVATTAALGQFASASPETRVIIFRHVAAYVQAAGAMDGLESLMLSGIDACHLAGASDTAHTGMALWNRFAQSASSKHARVAVFLSASQRIGFIGGDGSRALPHFGAYGKGEGDGPPGSVFSPGMPGGAIGRQLASAISGGFEKMDGTDFCHETVKYGVAAAGGVAAGVVVGLGLGIASKNVGVGIAGGLLGAVGGFLGALGAGKEIAGDVCGGSSSAGEKQAAGDYVDPDTQMPYTVTSDGKTVSGDPNASATYIGEVDDPNFVGGGPPGPAGAPSAGAPASDSSDKGTYVGEVDDPNFVSGGVAPAGGTAPAGDSSGSPSGGGSGSPGDSSGSPGSGGDSSGGPAPAGGMDNPETGTDEHGPRGGSGGLDNPEADPSSGGVRSGRSRSGPGGPLGGMDNPETGTTEGRPGGRGPLGGMDNPETGVGEGPHSRGFFQGGYAVTTQTFATQKGLQGSVRAITPALYYLQSLPLLAESSVGPVLLRAGLLEAAPPAALNQKGLAKQR